MRFEQAADGHIRRYFSRAERVENRIGAFVEKFRTV